MSKDMRIWKYELEISDFQLVSAPRGAEILSVGNQDGKLCMWAMVEADKWHSPIAIAVYSTGHPLPPKTESCRERKFLATVQIGAFVWHVFELVLDV